MCSFYPASRYAQHVKEWCNNLSVTCDSIELQIKEKPCIKHNHRFLIWQENKIVCVRRTQIIKFCIELVNIYMNFLKMLCTIHPKAHAICNVIECHVHQGTINNLDVKCLGYSVYIGPIQRQSHVQAHWEGCAPVNHKRCREIKGSCMQCKQATFSHELH